MQLVDGERRTNGVALCPRFHPGNVIEGVARFVGDRSRRWKRLCHSSKRIRLEHQTAARRANFKLVACTAADLGNEQLPDSRCAQRTHQMKPPVPAVKVADHAHAARVRRPHREGESGHTTEDTGMRPEALVYAFVEALIPQMEIEAA